MTDFKTKQRRFGAVLGTSRGALLLVVAFAIAGGSLLAYSHYQKPQQDKLASNVSTTAPATTASKIKAPVLQQQPSATAVNQSALTIPELGIQITVPNDIKDLKYQISTVTLRNGQQATLAMFSTAALTGLDAKCSASNGALGSLERANGQYPTASEDASNVLDYGQLVKQFPTFYVSAGFPNAQCSSNNSANAAAAKFKLEFATAESTIQQ